jgi:hypothetical protein
MFAALLAGVIAAFIVVGGMMILTLPVLFIKPSSSPAMMGEPTNASIEHEEMRLAVLSDMKGIS